jgi:phospholipid/cholesterol/gamma-HCH transport system substrate-binding protein
MDEPVEPGPRWRLLAFLVLGLAALGALIYFPYTIRHNSADATQLKTFLRDGRGLENNAEVRIAGIRVGRVISVRVKPVRQQTPVEVEMIIEPGYQMMVPADAKVRLGRAGVLGPTVVDIDVQFAKGPAAHNGDTLQSLD